MDSRRKHILLNVKKPNFPYGSMFLPSFSALVYSHNMVENNNSISHFQLCSIFRSLPTSPNPCNVCPSLHCSELLNHSIFFLHSFIPCPFLLLFQLLLLCIPSYHVFPSQMLHFCLFPLSLLVSAIQFQGGEGWRSKYNFLRTLVALGIGSLVHST